MRLLPGTLVLTTVLLFGPGSAAATIPQSAASTDTGWTEDQPLTGRAIPCDQGQIKTFKCQNVKLLSYLPPSATGGAAGVDLWGWIDSTTGREFAIVGGRGRTAFVEVTDPINPKYLGILPLSSVEQQVGQPSVKVYQHYAFIGWVYIPNGMQIFDLTQLRDVKTPPVVFQETAHYDKFANTHTLALNQETGFAYANGSNTCGGGLHMIDVRTPTQPTFVGCYTNTDIAGGIRTVSGGMTLQSGGGPGYVHDTQCVVYRGPDQQYKGREICLNSAASAVVIVDVTDKQQPKTISVARYPKIGFVHQGWLTEDQQYFFLDDELDEGMVGRTRTIVFDMRDLDDPVVLTEFLYTPTSTDHNLYIRGRYMYQGNYGAGLLIVDIADPKHPEEVGYLTNAGSTPGTYPFFKHDVVAVPMNTGLFLVRLLRR